MRHLTVTDSDIIESIGFEHTKKSGVIDPEVDRGALEVVFKGTPDTIYRYEKVLEHTFVVLLTSESIGKSFHEIFRKTKAPFIKSERKPTLKK